MLGTIIGAATALLPKGVKDAVSEAITARARSALGLKPDAPVSEINAGLQSNPEALARIRESADKLAAEMERTLQTEIVQTGETMRASIASQDKFISRMRPTIGYAVTALTAIVIGAEIAIPLLSPVTDTSLLKDASQSLVIMWAAVGVHSGGRSWEKVRGVTK